MRDRAVFVASDDPSIFHKVQFVRQKQELAKFALGQFRQIFRRQVRHYRTRSWEIELETH